MIVPAAATTLQLIDSHCHLHDTEFYPDPVQQQAIYQRALDAGVGMICVGTDQRSSQQAVAFAATHPATWAAVGVHPHEASHGWSGIAALLEQATPDDSPIVAIGEIGLDYYYNHSPRQVQIAALEAQIQLAVDHNVPISFHVRDGAAGQVSVWDDFWPIFDNFRGVRGVLHSFTDTTTNLEKGLARGLLVGLNGISTFTKDPNQLELYRSLSPETVIFETDAPFLTPKPFRGNLNEPGYVRIIAEYWAAQWQLPIEQLAAMTTATTRTLFHLNHT